MQGRGGRPDDGRGWEGRKQRREVSRVGVGRAPGSEPRPGSGSGARAGSGRATGLDDATGEERMGSWGEKRQDEAERGTILG